MKQILFYYLILILIHFSLSYSTPKEDEFYTKQFSTFTKDKRLQLNPDSHPIYVETKTDIPANSTLFKISKEQMFSSCSLFPYKELLSSFINEFLKQRKIIKIETYHEAVILVFQLFYYQYGNVDAIKAALKENIINYRYEINSSLHEYISIINSVSEHLNYIDLEKNPEKAEYMRKMGIYHRNYDIVSNLYDYVITTIKGKSNEQAKQNILPFIENKKDLFIRTFYFVYEKAIPLSGDVFNKVFNVTESFLHPKNSYCIMLSPSTDLLLTKVNKDQSFYSFDNYPFTDIKKNNRTYVLFFTRANINKGPLIRYSLLTNEDALLDLNVTSKEMDFHSRQINVNIEEKVFGKNLKENKHVKICQMTYGCRDIKYDNGFIGEFSLIEDYINPRMVAVGRFVNVDDDDIKDVEMFASTFMSGSVVSYENEMKAFVWYMNGVSGDFALFNKMFDEDAKKFLDLWELVYVNYDINIRNYEMVLDQMVVEMKKELSKMV